MSESGTSNRAILVENDEMMIVRHHRVVEGQFCSHLKSFRRLLPVIRHHHKKRKRSGYPDGLKDDKFPLIARTLQSADIDSLTTDSPHRKALQSKTAFSIIKEEIKRSWREGARIDRFEMPVAESRSQLAGVGAENER